MTRFCTRLIIVLTFLLGERDDEAQPVPGGKPGTVPGGGPRSTHMARPAVQPGFVPHLDQGVHDGGPERLVRPAAGLRGEPKARQSGGPSWSLIRPQIAVAVLLGISLICGLARLATGLCEPVGTLVDVAWVAYDLLVMSILVRAVRDKGFVPEERNTDAVQL